MKVPRVSDQELREAVAKSFSVAEALRHLGRSLNGGTHGHYSKRIKDLKIPTDHFRRTQQFSNGMFEKIGADRRLVKNEEGSRRTPAIFLKRSLLEIGVPYICSVCGREPEWMGKPLSLQVDHIDGNRNDDRRENLRFICPNCHTQTETYGNRLRRPKAPKVRKPRAPQVRKSKIDWPEKEVLLEMIAQSNYTQVGKKLGVSDNAIRKHLKQ